MNGNINLVEILKDCPKGTKLYSIIYGEVEFNRIEEGCTFSIIFVTKEGNESTVTSDGKHYNCYDGDCTLFPSKEQRDWSKFTAPWYKKEKFDPMTLQPFDKVLVNDHPDTMWKVVFYSHKDESKAYPYRCIGNSYTYCIPYNDETKQLVGTTDEAPEYYRYWED